MPLNTTETTTTTDTNLKATLPPGPWQDEPDKALWNDETTGLHCLIIRHPSGHLCGYVGIDTAHPWHGDAYNDHYEITVHGGLTYADSRDDDEIWWFGFDCAHLGDLTPRHFHADPVTEAAIALCGDGIGGGNTYRDFGYVTAEVTRLAEQLAAVTA